MAPSRTKQSRKARRVRRHYITLALTAADHTTPEAIAQYEARLAKAQAAVEALDLIGWETRAEGFTGDTDEEGDDEEAPTPRTTKKAKAKKAKGKKAPKASTRHADIPVTMATAGAR